MEYILFHRLSKAQHLSAKKVENLVYIHCKLRLLSHQKPKYNKGVTMSWDLAPECADLDVTSAQLAQVSIYDHVATLALDTTSGTGNPMDCSSNEVDPNGL